MELLFTQKLEILLKKVCKYQQSDKSHYAYGCSFAVDTYFIIQNYMPFEF